MERRSRMRYLVCEKGWNESWLAVSGSASRHTSTHCQESEQKEPGLRKGWEKNHRKRQTWDNNNRHPLGLCLYFPSCPMSGLFSCPDWMISLWFMKHHAYCLLFVAVSCNCCHDLNVVLDNCWRHSCSGQENDSLIINGYCIARLWLLLPSLVDVCSGLNYFWAPCVNSSLQRQVCCFLYVVVRMVLNVNFVCSFIVSVNRNKCLQQRRRYCSWRWERGDKEQTRLQSDRRKSWCCVRMVELCKQNRIQKKKKGTSTIKKKKVSAREKQKPQQQQPPTTNNQQRTTNNQQQQWPQEAPMNARTVITQKRNVVIIGESSQIQWVGEKGAHDIGTCKRNRGEIAKLLHISALLSSPRFYYLLALLSAPHMYPSPPSFYFSTAYLHAIQQHNRHN